jgi:hypothetical protein
MPGSPFQAFVARLCLVAAVLVGALPGKGMVLCVEADGCVSIEIAVGPSDCGGCAPDCAEEATESDPGPSDRIGGCPCKDVPIGSESEAIKVKPKLAGLDVHLAATACEFSTAYLERAGSIRASALLPARPRPPPALTLLEGVVLLV